MPIGERGRGPYRDFVQEMPLSERSSLAGMISRPKLRTLDGLRLPLEPARNIRASSAAPFSLEDHSRSTGVGACLSSGRLSDDRGTTLASFRSEALRWCLNSSSQRSALIKSSNESSGERNCLDP